MASRYLDPVDECWENLANAIILQACQDYYEGIRWLRGLKREQYDGPFCAILREFDYAKSFFCGAWFNFLTDINPEYLIETLENHAIHDMRNRKHRKYREDRAARDEDQIN